jgi:hypothetical protein
MNARHAISLFAENKRQVRAHFLAKLGVDGLPEAPNGLVGAVAMLVAGLRVDDISGVQFRDHRANNILVPRRPRLKEQQDSS